MQTIKVKSQLQLVCRNLRNIGLQVFQIADFDCQLLNFAQRFIVDFRVNVRIYHNETLTVGELNRIDLIKLASKCVVEN